MRPRAPAPERPSPDDLLRNLEAEEHRAKRGRLKIFLGYAPRVGKSERMLDEARRRAARGQDVVVGSLQEQDELTAADLGKLEIIPPVLIQQRETPDLDAILRRHPKVCVVDALAWDNPPGARNQYRWQDVEELVEAGITVLTALNVQYVAEQQDAVERITGRRAQVSVPQSFVQRADELVVVDVPVAGAAGLPGAPARSEAQLSELRELALLLAAEVVEGQLLRYMEEHDLQKSWGTQERVLVCLTPRSEAHRMLETAANVAARFHAHWTALYVGQGELQRGEQERLEEHLRYAEQLGADVQVLEPDGDPIRQILRYAERNRCTQIFVGHSQQAAWSFWKKNPVDRLIEAAENMDVRLFPHKHRGG